MVSGVGSSSSGNFLFNCLNAEPEGPAREPVGSSSSGLLGSPAAGNLEGCDGPEISSYPLATRSHFLPGWPGDESPPSGLRSPKRVSSEGGIPGIPLPDIGSFDLVPSGSSEQLESDLNKEEVSPPSSGVVLAVALPSPIPALVPPLSQRSYPLNFSVNSGGGKYNKVLGRSRLPAHPISRLSSMESYVHSLLRSGGLCRVGDLVVDLLDQDPNLVIAENARISRLPDSFTNRSIHTLRLKGNSLSEPPKAIGQLKHLTRLDLSSQAEDSGFRVNLTSSLWKATALKVLDLSHNRLRFLPPEIGRLKHLEEIRLNGNPGILLPNELYSLPRLKRVYLDDEGEEMSRSWQNQAAQYGVGVRFLMA